MSRGMGEQKKPSLPPSCEAFKLLLSPPEIISFYASFSS